MQMVKLMKVNGKTEKNTDKVSKNGVMEDVTKGLLIMIYQVDSEPYLLSMEIYTRDFGKMVRNMGKVRKLGKTAKLMMDGIKMTFRMVMEF